MKRLKGRNPFTNDPQGDVNTESDCEETKDELPDAKEEGEELIRAVLLTGSFSACVYHLQTLFFLEKNDGPSSWKSLFFYRCTDVISFAPLRSQGADVRLNYILEKAVAAVPPPCSPKSAYVLANLVRESSGWRLGRVLIYRIKLEIPSLCERALADIKSKVTLDNVVDEIFSRVTGR